MKTFDQLTKQEKIDAIDIALYDLITSISIGMIVITLVNPASQKRFEKILSEGRKKESQRLIRLHLVHDKPIREELYKLAIVAAHGSEYGEDGLPIKKEVRANDETVRNLVGESQGNANHTESA